MKTHDFVSHIARSPGQIIRIAAVVTLMLANLGNPAAARDDGQTAPPPDYRGSYFEMPVWHVQPTLRDLPPGVAQREGMRTKSQENFDRKLQICRDC